LLASGLSGLGITRWSVRHCIGDGGRNECCTKRRDPDDVTERFGSPNCTAKSPASVGPDLRPREAFRVPKSEIECCPTHWRISGDYPLCLELGIGAQFAAVPPQPTEKHRIIVFDQCSKMEKPVFSHHERTDEVGECQDWAWQFRLRARQRLIEQHCGPELEGTGSEPAIRARQIPRNFF
jgi:hypothetical protein